MANVIPVCQCSTNVKLSHLQSLHSFLLTWSFSVIIKFSSMPCFLVINLKVKHSDKQTKTAIHIHLPESDIVLQVLFGSDKLQNDTMLTARNLRVFTMWSVWGKCNVCGQPGRRKRVGQCTVKVKVLLLGYLSTNLFCFGKNILRVVGQGKMTT